MGGHDDLLAHHILKGQHHFAGIHFEDPGDEMLVGFGMAGFIGSDNAAEPRQMRVAVFLGQGCRPAVGDVRRGFLKGSIYKIPVRVAGSTQVHAVGDEMLGRDLHLAHIDAAGQIYVFVEQVAVPVLFRSPHPDPFAPAFLSGLTDAFDVHQPGFVGRQGFFGDDISNQYYHVVVGEVFTGFSEVADLFSEILLTAIGQQICRLPVFVNFSEELVDGLFCLLREEMHHLPAGWIKGHVEMM